MTLTPRQIFAYHGFNAKLDRIERAHDLVTVATGAQCDGKAIEKRLKELGAL
jgi:hypothetical protein